MKRIITILTVLCIFGSSAVFAAGITVGTTRGYDITLDVDCPKVTIGNAKVLGSNVVTVSAPESKQAFDRGAPELPRYTAMLMIDPARRPLIQVTSIENETIDLSARVIPSKGNFGRDIDPNSVPYVFGDMYTEDAWYPSNDKLAFMTEPFIFREIRGVNLVVNPVQYNPIKNQLKVHKKIRIRVQFDAKPSKNIMKSSTKISKTFEPIYEKTFVNFKETARRLPRLPEEGRLLILCHDEFMAEMAPFVEWKTKIGMQVKLVPTSAVGAVTVENIHAFIQDEYNQGGLTHILLVGDAQQIPAPKGVRERADSDPCYTKLAGDDHIPDAIISRLLAVKPEQVAYQVAKFVNYERFPTTDQTWYTRVLGVASNEGNPPDHAYITKNNEALLKASFKEAIEVYQPQGTVQQVSDALNKGVSLINYLGHGSGTSWGSPRFGNTNIKQLKNGWMLPIIWDVACVNGKFVNYDGFGKNWLQAGDIDNPAGAVAYAGATTNMEWVPPIHVQAEFNQNYIANEVYKTVGGIFINGIIKGFELYGTSSTSSALRMFEQWHIFGDSTLLTRFKAPIKVAAESRGVRSSNNTTVKVNVLDKAGKAVSNARVVAYTEGIQNVKVAYTNVAGEAVLTMPADMTDGYVTIIHSDIVPVVDQAIEFAK